MSTAEPQPDVPPAAPAPPPMPTPRRHEPWPDVARRFAFEITAITAGVLIALGIDSVSERNRERALVAQARAAIRREIGDNVKELGDIAANREKQSRQLEQGLRFANQLLERGATDVNSVGIGYSYPSLSSASWQTADRTGALGYMDYEVVKNYSEVYDLQAIVADSQRQMIAKVGGLFPILLSNGGDPSKAARADIELFRARLLDVYGGEAIYWSLVEQLDKRYRTILAGSNPAR